MDTNKETKTTSADEVILSRAQYEELLAKLSTAQASLQEAQSDNRNLKSRLEWLEHVLRSANRARFGSKSERLHSETVAGMESLFDEAEATQYVEEEHSRTEAEGTVVKEHVRRKRTSAEDLINNLPPDTPKDIYEHFLEGDAAKCPNCGAEMEIIGSKEQKHLVIIPAQVRLRVDVYYVYACKSCPDNGSNITVVEAPRKKSVLPGSYASPEAIAHIMVQKFAMGSPLYRLESEFSRQKILLTRQTMSNWILNAAERWLKPVYDRLHSLLVKQDVLHADETPLQVLKEDGRSSQSRSYMWLYRTSGCAEHPIVLYKYEQGRKTAYPAEYLRGFKGYLHTDGYEVYHRLGSEIVNVGCMIHARRNFYEIIKDKKNGVNREAAKAVGYFTRISKIEDSLAALSAEERYQKRLELEKPVLDELFAWANTVYATPKSGLGEALTYLKNQKEYLYNYLLDGRLEWTNNRAERSIKPFVISRKNFLFANTPKGAEGSATIFSIIETAKENNLDPYRYLVYVLKTAPNLDQSEPDWIEQLLPENAPEECLTIHNRK